MQPLFLMLGLEHKIIETTYLHYKTFAIIHLLLEWARTTRNPTYQELADALRVEHQYTLDIAEVSCVITHPLVTFIT